MLRHGVILLAAAVGLTVVGCAAVQQAREDYSVGSSTPLVEGEISPQVAAGNLVDPLRPFLPAPLQPLAGFLVTGLAAFGTWRRGKKIRQGQTPSANPITGSLGSKIGLEGGVQALANMSTGLFQIGSAGSAGKRAWKVALLTAGTLGVAALGLEPLREFIVSRPDIAVIVTGLAGLLGAIEKKIQTILPVAKTQ